MTTTTTTTYPPVQHPAMILSECYADGSPIPGTGLLAMPTLDQDEVWRTADGRVVALDEMEPSHRRNLLAWLDRRALYLLIASQSQMMFGPLGPRGDMATLDAERALEEELDRYRDDPLPWLREQPLYRRLAAMIEVDAAVAAEEAPY